MLHFFNLQILRLQQFGCLPHLFFSKMMLLQMILLEFSCKVKWWEMYSSHHCQSLFGILLVSEIQVLRNHPRVYKAVGSRRHQYREAENVEGYLGLCFIMNSSLFDLFMAVTCWALEIIFPNFREEDLQSLFSLLLSLYFCFICLTGVKSLPCHPLGVSRECLLNSSPLKLNRITEEEVTTVSLFQKWPLYLCFHLLSAEVHIW